MKFLKSLAAIDTEVAFRGIQTLYRIKNFSRREGQRPLAIRVWSREAHDNRRVERSCRSLASLQSKGKWRRQNGKGLSKITLISSTEFGSVLESCRLAICMVPHIAISWLGSGF